MIYKRNNKFYVKLSNPQGIKKAIPAYSSKRASLQFENKLKQLSELQAVNEPLPQELNRWIETLAPDVKERLAKAGFLSDSKINSSRALSELIKDYQVYLKDKGRAKDYYSQAYNQCKKIIEGNKFKVITDISADKLDKWLSGKRNNENMSYRTSNGYLVAFKSFCNWLVNTNKITNNPVKSLKKLNEKEDRRLIRRTLSEDEFSAFLKAARGGGRFKGMSGHEWYLLFLTASQTGYRWSELKSLTRACIDFDSMTITIKAKNTKNRKDNTMPLRVELAELLYEHCRNMLPQANLFKLPYRNCGGQAVKFYLAATGSPEKGIDPIPYED